MRSQKDKDRKALTIPADQMFLSMSHNKTLDGEIFDKDGYVYRKILDNGEYIHKRLRKWFVFRKGWGDHFWPPVKEQLHRIEQLYNRAEARVRSIWSDAPGICAAILKNGKIAHYKGKDVNGSYWGCYEVDKMDHLHSFHRNLLKEKPKRPVNLVQGRLLYSLEERAYKNSHRKDILRGLLEDAIELALGKIKFKMKDVDTVLELHINGRRYIYIIKLEGYRTVPKKLAWPGDRYRKIEF